MLKITRLNSYMDRLRSYKVIIDGNLYAEIKSGETKHIDLNPGEHTIYLKIDWCRSNIVNFKVLENDTVEFNCGNSAQGWKSWFVIFYVIFLKNKYLWIKENKRNIKNQNI